MGRTEIIIFKREQFGPVNDRRLAGLEARTLKEGNGFTFLSIIYFG